jgi:hypothetical protein
MKSNHSEKLSGLRCDLKRLGLEPIPRSSRNNLAGTHVELAGTVRERRTVVVNVPNKTPTAAALDLGPLPLDPPVVDGLEEGLDLVLLLEPELGGVDPREGKRALVPSLEVELRWEEMGRAEIEVGLALLTAVDRGHG